MSEDVKPDVPDACRASTFSNAVVYGSGMMSNVIGLILIPVMARLVGFV